ncbi:hypothetical protein BWI17_00840 [Betaproteobacteria bacterium GR16-43]|nr:hypothetical protein BWI17_00840 [Betaproteobacteria bacterium GR16-43]
MDMTTPVSRRIAAFSFALALAPAAHAYNDTITHPHLTGVAAEKSAIYTDPLLMKRLGLPPADQLAFTYRGRVGSFLFGQLGYTLSGLMGEGAFDEDVGDRAKRHFYDPINDRGLYVLGFEGYPSYRWMLEDQGPIPEQAFSLFDARDQLERALTYNTGSPKDSDSARGTALATMILSLGHAMHHMQDMHQPQHVRNDDHLDQWALLGLNPYYKPSRYEAYTAMMDDAIGGYAAAGSPVYPGSSDYKVARDFWFNGNGSGSAQYVNRNYVSQGKNFQVRNGVAGVGAYGLPMPGVPTDFTVEQIFTVVPGTQVPPQIKTLCGDPAIDCTMTMYPAGPAARASTLSIFDQDLREKGVTVIVNDFGTPTYLVDRLFALNRFNFDSVHPSLLSSAVGYSAGLVNHFFRGKIDVLPPDSGAFAVVDHSTGAGFKKIRAQIQNATPGEDFTNGTLVAIARFHRNGCYKADLSGEWKDNGTPIPEKPCDDYRSAEEHIRVTASQPLSLTAGTKKAFTFEFADEIPLDATDLILQVFFKGQVGAEVNSFAVGALDISEPTFITVMNGTDVFEIPSGGQGTFFYYGDIVANVAQAPYSIVDTNGDQNYSRPPDVDVFGGNIHYLVSVDGVSVGEVPALPEGRFFRIALLVKTTGFQLTLNANGNGFFGPTTYSMPAKTAQVDYAANSYVVSTVRKLRKQAYHNDSVTFWHFYPTSSAAVKDMIESKATEATELIEVTIADQPNP